MRVVERCRLAFRSLLAVAVLENDFWSAFYKQYLVARGRLVERRHEFVFRLERDGVSPRRGRLLGSAIHAELAREGIERSLGGIAFSFPRPFLLEQLGVVAKHRDATHKREYRIDARWLSVFPNFAFGRIAVAADLIRGLGGDGRHHHHLHQSECTGFVGADPRYRAERLDRRQSPDYRVAL